MGDAAGRGGASAGATLEHVFETALRGPAPQGSAGRVGSAVPEARSARDAVYIGRGRAGVVRNMSVAGGPGRVVRDPVYGYVRLPDRLASVVDSRIFQRLRRVAQTSLTSTVYPSATGTRLEHGLGTMHLAGIAWRAAWSNAAPRTQEEFRRQLERDVPALRTVNTDVSSFPEEVETAVMAVGLLHDLGHPPFSHVLEPLYKARAEAMFADGPDGGAIVAGIAAYGSQYHEYAGERLLQEFVLPLLPSPLRELLSHVYTADPLDRSPAGCLHSIVSGELDVDRLDYLMRDGQRAGTEFGSLDWTRLVEALKLRRWEDGFKIAPDARARSAAESLIVARLQAYRWVSLHQRVLGTNAALLRALELLMDLHQSPEMLTLPDGTPVEARAAFGGLLANLNYLNPTAAQLDDRAVGGALAAGLALKPFQEQACASVDDSAVVRSLLQARLWAELAAPRSDPPAQSRLRMLMSYVDAALMRQKTFVSVWKNEAQFEGAATALFADGTMTRAVTQALEDWPEPTEGPPLDRERLLALPPLQLLNWMFGEVLGREHLRRELERLLGRHVDEQVGLAGRWVVSYSPLKAVRRRQEGGALLWGPDGKEFWLSEDSAMVRELVKVEAERVRSGFFYFVEDARLLAAPAQRQDLQRVLLGILLDALKEFVAGHLAEGLRVVEPG